MRRSSSFVSRASRNGRLRRILGSRTLRNRVKQAERDKGKRPDGLSTGEREELHRQRRKNAILRMEREILGGFN